MGHSSSHFGLHLDASPFCSSVLKPGLYLATNDESVVKQRSWISTARSYQVKHVENRMGNTKLNDCHMEKLSTNVALII